MVSQTVMEHVDDLEGAYKAMGRFIKSGGHFIHHIGFNMHMTATEWNGHFTYSDLMWKIVRGKCKYIINREPYSRHIELMKKYGFEVISEDIMRKENKLKKSQLAKRFKNLTKDDLETWSTVIVGRKI